VGVKKRTGFRGTANASQIARSFLTQKTAKKAMAEAMLPISTTVEKALKAIACGC